MTYMPDAHLASNACIYMFFVYICILQRQQYYYESYQQWEAPNCHGTAMMIRAQMKPHHDAIMKKLTLNSRHSEGGDCHNNIKNDTMIAEFAHRPLYMSLHTPPPPPLWGGDV